MLEKISNDHYRLHGQFDMKNSANLIAELFSIVDNKKSSVNQLQLDVSHVESADSVLLAAIIHIARSMEMRNGVLRVTGFPDKLRGLARTYGIDALIERYMVVT